MEFELTKHAQWRMELRGISLEDVRRVLDEPGQILTDPCGQNEIYQSVFLGEDGKPYLLRVFVNHRTALPKVVTVYRTSKVAKYWGKQS